MSFHDDYLMSTCLRRLKNYQLSSFCLNYNGKEYRIVFEWYYDNNTNDFIICNASSIICANLNRLNRRKRL